MGWVERKHKELLVIITIAIFIGILGALVGAPFELVGVAPGMTTLLFLVVTILRKDNEL